MNWRVGDEIAIATTGHRHSQKENEKRKITGISSGKNLVKICNQINTFV